MSSVEAASKAMSEVQPSECLVYLIDLFRGGKLISEIKRDWMHVGVCFVVAVGYILQKLTNHSHDSTTDDNDQVFGEAGECDHLVAELGLELGVEASSTFATTSAASAPNSSIGGGIFLLILKQLAKRFLDELVDYIDTK